ncbi:MAG TPA: hypothetical protein PK821_08430, partial [Victivallales bacterium]|nr:hypothetical protein [Victivallales bacterium]
IICLQNQNFHAVIIARFTAKNHADWEIFYPVARTPKPESAVNLCLIIQKTRLTYPLIEKTEKTPKVKCERRKYI